MERLYGRDFVREESVSTLLALIVRRKGLNPTETGFDLQHLHL